jgi:hypothetical protein
MWLSKWLRTFPSFFLNFNFNNVLCSKQKLVVMVFCCNH